MGELTYEGLDSWEAYLLYMSFVIVLRVVFFTLLIAMIASTFNAVSR